MATSGTVLAKNMALYIDGSPDTVVTCQVDATISMETATFDTTCKDSGAWSEPRPGTKSWTASVTGNLAFDATFGAVDFFDAWSAQGTTDIVFGTGVTGDVYLYGSAYVTSLEWAASGNDAPVTFSATLTGTGALAKATYPS